MTKKICTEILILLLGRTKLLPSFSHVRRNMWSASVVEITNARRSRWIPRKRSNFWNDYFIQGISFSFKTTRSHSVFQHFSTHLIVPETTSGISGWEGCGLHDLQIFAWFHQSMKYSGLPNTNRKRETTQRFTKQDRCFQGDAKEIWLTKNRWANVTKDLSQTFTKRIFVVSNCLARSQGSKCLLAAVRWCGFFNSLSCLAHFIAASGSWASATLQENLHLLEARNNRNKLLCSGAKMFKGPTTPDFCKTSFCLRQ